MSGDGKEGVEGDGAEAHEQLHLLDGYVLCALLPGSSARNPCPWNMIRRGQEVRDDH